MPPALSVIQFSRTHFPGLPQFACFDTSFHVHMPDIARVLPIPQELRAEGVERYGFHGLSCESRQQKLDATQLGELVDRRSGLLGVSGVSADLRDLHKVSHSNNDARLAIAMFCYSAAKQLAAMSAALGGIDEIVFTGGIGENDTQGHALICGHLGVLGVRLDAARNRDASDPISASDSRCQVRVLPSLEDEQIARQVWTLY